jgi:hypothetical protein
MTTAGHDGAILRVGVVVRVRQFETLPASEDEYRLVGQYYFLNRIHQRASGNLDRLAQHARSLESGFHHFGASVVSISSTQFGIRLSGPSVEINAMRNPRYCFNSAIRRTSMEKGIQTIGTHRGRARFPRQQREQRMQQVICNHAAD